jgi:hypothetical protein
MRFLSKYSLNFLTTFREVFSEQILEAFQLLIKCSSYFSNESYSKFLKSHTCIF